MDDDQQDDDDDKLDHTADYEPVGEQFYYPPSMPINGEEGWQGYLPTVVGMKGRPHIVTAGNLPDAAVAAFRCGGKKLQARARMAQARAKGGSCCDCRRGQKGG